MFEKNNPKSSDKSEAKNWLNNQDLKSPIYQDSQQQYSGGCKLDIANFELTAEEIQELIELKVKGYKTIAAEYEENGSTLSKCLLCQNQKIEISSFAVDDNKKEVFLYSLCADCLVKLSLASAVLKITFQQLLDKKIDRILSNAQNKRE
jgi:hypothetical protein